MQRLYKKEKRILREQKCSELLSASIRLGLHQFLLFTVTKTPKIFLHFRTINRLLDNWWMNRMRKRNFNSNCNIFNFRILK